MSAGKDLNSLTVSKFPRIEYYGTFSITETALMSLGRASIHLVISNAPQNILTI